MLTQDLRTAVLALARKKHGIRAIARALGIARATVREILASGHPAVPTLQRPSVLDPQRAAITQWHEDFQGNLVLVHEAVVRALGRPVGYTTLTAFCRKHGIGVAPKVPAGRYDFAPGEEMQHDTSPHVLVLGGVRTKVHVASLALCHSRMLFAQVYRRFTRFWCKVFLTEAFRAFGGVARTCMIDNTHVVVLRGSGPHAVMHEELGAFARRFGFAFKAHRIGDANRSARVERPFHYIETNFLPRFPQYADEDDANAKLRAWCDAKNHELRRGLGFVPADRFVAERAALVPLPPYVPEVEQLHPRTVDVEGFVHLHGNRYSVPAKWIDLAVTVHEGARRVRVYRGHELVAEHTRAPDGAHARLRLPEHREDHLRHRRERVRADPPPDVASRPRTGPALDAWLEAALAHGEPRKRIVDGLARLHEDYGGEALERALRVALDHRLFQLARIETIVLRERFHRTE